MKTNFRHTSGALLSLALMFAFLLTLPACSSKSGGSTVPETANPGYGYDSNGMFTKDDIADAADKETGTAVTDRKLIERISLSVQTKAFQTFVDETTAEIAALGGYIEQSDISGDSYDRRQNRSATIVARIPADKSAAFTARVSSLGTITHENKTVSDVTLNYADTQAHITALRTEEASLLRLLEAAESLSDILTVQDRLTKVRQQIESYESQLRTMENQILYSTITLSVREVDREAEIVKEQGLWAEIGTNLKNNLYAIGSAARAVFIWFVSALPYLLLLSIVVIPIIYFAVIRPAKRQKERKRLWQSPAAKPDQTPPEQQPYTKI